MDYELTHTLSLMVLLTNGEDYFLKCPTKILNVHLKFIKEDMTIINEALQDIQGINRTMTLLSHKQFLQKAKDHILYTLALRTRSYFFRR